MAELWYENQPLIAKFFVKWELQLLLINNRSKRIFIYRHYRKTITTGNFNRCN